MQVVNFSNLSIAELKEWAAKLNAKVEGDKRVKQTWVFACEVAQKAAIAAGESAKSAAQSALVKAGESVNQLAGNDVVASLGVTVQAVGEAYGIARTMFVVPIENKIKSVVIAVSSDEAIEAYLNAVIRLFYFCCVVYDMGAKARELYEQVRVEIDEFVAECEAELPEGMEPTVARVMVARCYAVKGAVGRRVWAIDEMYQIKVVEPVKREVMAVFSLAEWVAFLMR